MAYYAEKLSGDRLRECYEIAPPRVKRYFDTEIAHVLSRIGPDDDVLEVGCGYGRVAFELASRAAGVTGIDTAVESIVLARRLSGERKRCAFFVTDALSMAFPDGAFDVVTCVQNGICAFGVDKARLVGEMCRVTRPGGRVLFSSYADRFWPHRLRWFERQAERGLVGEIDREATSRGTMLPKLGYLRSR